MRGTMVTESTSDPEAVA